MPKLITFLLFVLFSLFLLQTCNSPTSIEPSTRFQIKVDSMKVIPDSVSVHSFLGVWVALYGTIGPKGCNEYDTMITDTSITDTLTHLKTYTFYGKHYPKRSCSDTIDHFNYVYDCFFPKAKGMFYIKASQPDGSFLVDSVFVY